MRRGSGLMVEKVEWEEETREEDERVVLVCCDGGQY